MPAVCEAPLVLASRSPQRLALLARLGMAPSLILPVDIDEAALRKETARALVSRLALAKASAAREQLGKRQAQSKSLANGDPSGGKSGNPSGGKSGNPSGRISHVLAADTAVVCSRRILGKPRNAQQASEFLEMLSGRRHQVWSAVVLASPKGWQESSTQRDGEGGGEGGGKKTGRTAGEETRIRVRMTRVAFKRLMQKEIEDYIASKEWQGSAGAYRIQGFAEAFVRSLNGSYSAVVGLPLFETRQLLVSQNLL